MTAAADRDVAAADASDVAALTAGVNGWTTGGSPALGVRSLRLVDGPLGVVSTKMDERDRSTLFPSGPMLAASWDPNVVAELASVLGAEARAAGVDVLLAPNLGIPRNPLSGRAFEMFSEDPWLTSVIGVAYVDGMQSQGVAACPKHLVGNDTETARRTMNAQMTDATLREVYLLPFEYTLAAGARMVLTAYNRVNGIPAVSNAALLSIAKHEWNWPGVVVSDWFGIENGTASARAGLDLEMPGPARYFGNALADAVQNGIVERDRLNDMGRRIMGLTRWIDESRAAGVVPRLTRPAAEVLERAAVSGTVLLKNSSKALPVDPHTTNSITVIGPLARSMTLQGNTFGRVTPNDDVLGLADALAEEFQKWDTSIMWRQGLTEDGPRPLTLLDPRDLDGVSGFTVEYRQGSSSEPLSTEHRDGASFVWFHRIPGLGATQEAGAVTVRCDVAVDVSGEYRLGVSGTGTLALAVDGVEVVRRRPPSVADIMGVVARGEPETAGVFLVAGKRTRIEATAEFEASHVQSFGLTVTVPQASAEELMSDAVSAAAASDVAIVVVGDDVSTTRESVDLESSGLPAGQVALIHAVAQANPRTVVVVNAARAVDMPWADDVAAVVCAWYGGQRVGPALASIVSGREQPSGRLPVTIAQRDADYPAFGHTLDEDRTLDYDRSEPVGHRHFESRGLRPRFAFGHGLGYTTFDVRVGDIDVPDTPGVVRVAVDVANTGRRSGSEVVQCYARWKGETSHRLAGFTRVEVEPGESSRAVIEVPLRAFMRWQSGGFGIPADTVHELRIGRSAVDGARSEHFTWGEAVVVDSDEVTNTAQELGS